MLFPDQTHLLFEAMTKKIIDSIALFGTYCTCLTKLMYIDLIVMKRAKEFKQLIFVAKSKGHKRKAFQTDNMEIRYNCAKRYHVLYLKCTEGIIFGLVSDHIITSMPSSLFNNSVNQGK